MATADYYRRQATACLHMSRVCPDPILAERLDGLATAFFEAATDRDSEAFGTVVPAPVAPKRRRMQG